MMAEQIQSQALLPSFVTFRAAKDVLSILNQHLAELTPRQARTLIKRFEELRRVMMELSGAAALEDALAISFKDAPIKAIDALLSIFKARLELRESSVVNFNKWRVLHSGALVHILQLHATLNKLQASFRAEIISLRMAELAALKEVQRTEDAARLKEAAAAAAEGGDQHKAEDLPVKEDAKESERNTEEVPCALLIDAVEERTRLADQEPQGATLRQTSAKYEAHAEAEKGAGTEDVSSTNSATKQKSTNSTTKQKSTKKQKSPQVKQVPSTFVPLLGSTPTCACEAHLTSNFTADEKDHFDTVTRKLAEAAPLLFSCDGSKDAVATANKLAAAARRLCDRPCMNNYSPALDLAGRCFLLAAKVLLACEVDWNAPKYDHLIENLGDVWVILRRRSSPSSRRPRLGLAAYYVVALRAHMRLLDHESTPIFGLRFEVSDALELCQSLLEEEKGEVDAAPTTDLDKALFRPDLEGLRANLRWVRLGGSRTFDHKKCAEDGVHWLEDGVSIPMPPVEHPLYLEAAFVQHELYKSLSHMYSRHCRLFRRFLKAQKEMYTLAHELDRLAPNALSFQRVEEDARRLIKGLKYEIRRQNGKEWDRWSCRCVNCKLAQVPTQLEDLEGPFATLEDIELLREEIAELLGETENTDASSDGELESEDDWMN